MQAEAQLQVQLQGLNTVVVRDSEDIVLPQHDVHEQAVSGQMILGACSGVSWEVRVALEEDLGIGVTH